MILAIIGVILTGLGGVFGLIGGKQQADKQRLDMDRYTAANNRLAEALEKSNKNI